MMKNHTVLDTHLPIPQKPNQIHISNNQTNKTHNIYINQEQEKRDESQREKKHLTCCCILARSPGDILLSCSWANFIISGLNIMPFCILPIP